MKTALDLFRSGLDTMEISAVLGIHESTASTRVWIERSRDLGKPFDNLNDFTIKQKARNPK